MTEHRDVGPPECERPAPPQDRPFRNNTDATEFNRPFRRLPICDRLTVEDTRRRRDAARRLISLDCGCPTGPHVDPLSCSCTFPPLSGVQLDGWAAAARHVLATGEVPLVRLEVRRALWRRGGADRELAELLHRACGEVVA